MGDVRELVHRAKEGDHQAFADLYDQVSPLVRSVAYDATGRLQEAEDLCQDIFVHAYRNLKQLRDAARFPGWLMMIARRGVRTVGDAGGNGIPRSAWKRLKCRSPCLMRTTTRYGTCSA